MARLLAILLLLFLIVSPNVSEARHIHRRVHIVHSETQSTSDTPEDPDSTTVALLIACAVWFAAAFICWLVFSKDAESPGCMQWLYGLPVILLMFVIVGVVQGLSKATKITLSALRKHIPEWQLHHWAISSCCILLLITIIGGGDDCLWETYNLPNGYYTLLRLTVTATAVYLGYNAVKNKAHPLCVLACAALVLIFQPLAPISFGRGTWLWIDLATAPLLLLCAMYGCKAGKPENAQT